MAVQRGTHPSADVLKAFGLGKLDDSSSGVVLDHLDQCDDCRKQVASLSGDDFLNRLRQVRGRSFTPAPAKALANVSRAGRAPAGRNPVPNLPPELVNNPQYDIVRELGRGGMGVVYLAKNKLMDRLEVLKVVNKALLDHPAAVERFLREIRAAAKLSHANVVGAYSAVQFGELLAFAMEYVEGQDLAGLVKSQGPLPIVHACYYIQQAASGLQHAFEKGMVHRDIKPQNLILAREGKKHIVKVLDFGLAKATREKKDDTGLTGEGKMLGTPDYIAPEQTLDAAKADIRADIYSLGCTLYYLLAGHPPFSANSLGAILMAHQMQEAKPLNLERPEVPEELAAVVRRMMAKTPAKRYQTPLDVVQVLGPFVKQGATPRPSPELSLGTPEAKPAVKIAARVDPPSAPSLEVPKAQPAPAAIWESLTESSIAPVGAGKSGIVRNPRAASVRRRTSQKKWLISGGIGAVVLLLALMGTWASGVFKMKIEDGTLVLEDLPADAEVLVDGGRATVKWVADGKSAEVSLAPGKRQVVVKLAGFQVKGEEVVIEEGGQKRLTVRLEPLAKAAPPAPQGGPDKPLPSQKWWEQLFDKRDLRSSLSGQRGKPWFVVDGSLGSDSRGGSIFTKRSYANFNLSMEFQISEDTAASIDIWSYPGDTPIWVFLDNTRNAMGAITFDLKEKGFSVRRLNPPAVLRPEGQWNELAIDVADCALSVSLNGRALDTANIRPHIDGRRSDSPPAERLMGHIGFSKRWGNGKILIRKLSIEEVIQSTAAEHARFTIPADVEHPVYGGWKVKNNELVKESVWGARLLFGKKTWTDYDFTVEGQMTDGNCGFGMMVRNSGVNLYKHPQDGTTRHKDHLIFLVGGLANSHHYLEQVRDGKGEFLTIKRLEPIQRLRKGEWYTARVSVRGDHIRCYLNSDKLFDVSANPPPAGLVGLMTWDNSFRFRNIKVTDPAGKVMLEGLPDLENRKSE